MSTGSFGRYIIKGEIGRGGMATVFHAYDPRFERDVAIKVLPHEFLHDPQFRTRFDREAKMVALLEHPAIVPVYDFGEEEGQPYIVMRYLSGGSLAERIQKGAIPLNEVVKTISRLAPALDAAHAKGIIHRDLKPGNILFDQYDNAFLSDFGIAHLTQTSSATLTGGAILGTPAYMSPEQVQGGSTIDGRSDIYSLGVLIYQMLVGKTPYQADTAARLMMMHLLEPVPHILDADVELPARLDDVIAVAMAKEPADRYQSTQELAEALTAAANSGLESTFIRKQAAAVSATIPSAVPAPRANPPTPSPAPASAHPITPAPAAARPITSPQAAPRPAPRRSSRLFLVIAGVIVLLVLAVVSVAGGIYLFGRIGAGNDPLTSPATATQGVVAVVDSGVTAQPSNTPPPMAASPTTAPSDTPQPSPQPSDTAVPPASDTPQPPTQQPSDTPPPAAPMLGGSDMLAFVRDSDIWVVRLDGSELVQLTTDGGTKNQLQWTPDGQNLVYISGLCVKIVRLADGQVNDVLCFEYAGTLIEEFEISPDGKRAAISVNQELYIVPFDLAVLQDVDRPSKVKEIADCAAMGPYASSTGSPFAVFAVRWSQDMTQMAVLMKIIYGQQQEDAVRLLDISFCGARPTPLDEFPSTRFRIGQVTRLENTAFDGFYNFSLVKIVRNEGFGELYFYNSDLHKPDPNINPVDGVCCYRDPSYSPNGSYLAFAFQDIRLGAASTTQLYYIPVGTLFTSLSYTPIPLPEGFFSNVKESPQPVARPATGLP